MVYLLTYPFRGFCHPEGDKYQIPLVGQYWYPRLVCCYVLLLLHTLASTYYDECADHAKWLAKD